MAKNLNRETRIHSYGGDDNEMFAYSLIAFDSENNDSCVTLIRGEKMRIPKLLKKYGFFTDDAIQKVLSMQYKDTWWIDDLGLIVRIS